MVNKLCYLGEMPQLWNPAFQKMEGSKEPSFFGEDGLPMPRAIPAASVLSAASEDPSPPVSERIITSQDLPGLASPRIPGLSC